MTGNLLTIRDDKLRRGAAEITTRLLPGGEKKVRFYEEVPRDRGSDI